MPNGFFTIERRQPPTPGAEPQWILVRDLDSSHSLTDAYEVLVDLNEPGFYRVIQTQRMIWAEKRNDELRLKKWHAGSADDLARTAAAFERDGGRWPTG